MNALFCSNLPLTKELGAPKVIMELAEALGQAGWHCTTIGSPELAGEHPDALRTATGYRSALRLFLRRRAAEFDVVDYDHVTLPFPRSDFSRKPLFVARSVLLAHHHQSIRLPRSRSWRGRLGALFREPARRRALAETVEAASITIREADLVNVPNTHDKAELMRHGIPAEKIIVIPYGIGEARRALFSRPNDVLSEPPIVAFVGTFDYRKGASEFPQLVSQIANRIPSVIFRLLGSRGQFPTAEAVLRHFPARLRRHLEVVPHFAPEELPKLLAPCAAGVFPSYFEGFGFGVLEMLAAGLPVVGYDAPGASMILLPECLVPPGDVAAMSAKVIELLSNGNKLNRARRRAAERALDFSWEGTARATSAAYMAALGQRG